MIFQFGFSVSANSTDSKLPSAVHNVDYETCFTIISYVASNVLFERLEMFEMMVICYGDIIMI